MAEGMILIFVLQYIFLSNIRAAFITSATIPFALAFAIGLLLLLGESANLLSVGAIDFGLVVDATVIMVENILGRSTPDVIILSLEMGDLEGVDLVSSVHAATGAPLLVLTPASRSVTPSAILDAGADDCMDEPFLLEELAARTRRLLHRAGVHIAPKVLITGLGRLEISSLKRIVSLRGVPLALTRREFDLLAVLARANGGVVSHGEILREVWGARGDAKRENLSRVIGRLRRKIEPEPAQPTCLVSVQGTGYRLRAQQERGDRV
jgi:two-component system, OmpR family, KDP operon response regulator KdpE